MEEKAKILIVDDDESICKTMKLIFEAKGYDIEIANTGQEAIAAIQRNSFNLAILDIRLPDMDGVDLFTQLSEMNDTIEIIMITGYASIETAVKALTKGAAAYITKPPNMDEVLATVNMALEKQRLTREKLRAEEALRRLTEELEQRVETRTRELEAANQELEAFAYSVSHDLRTPLRGIAGFGMAVLEDYSDVLDETGRDYLRRIHEATVRMSELIDDMLSLSRVSREAMHSKEIDMTALARTIAGELRSQEPGRDVKLTISDNLMAYGDERLMYQVLENLLGNAWKFTSKHPSARIEFGATEQEEEIVFFVRDNGVGFDMKYVDKMFNVFQRLHHADEFEGTGIGLAIVKRIINRHGGRTWAEGNVGTGATFHFALPSEEGGKEHE